jgi:acyl-CoA reductase-like NAD-dependent aldehyde dehydrogenase
MNIGEQNFFIGGQWTPSESGETYESLDPFMGETATRTAFATVQALMPPS